jgi:virginiamycin B lyase
MRNQKILAAVVATLALGLYTTPPNVLRAQGSAALTGVVSSQEEGKMEGVVVTARRAGALFDVSVVSDAGGRYSFPTTHLVPGQYTLKMRAAGYDLVDPGPVQVAAGKGATLDLKLAKAKDLSRQLNSVEWAMSLPGPDAQKDLMIRQAESCTYCHSLERIIKSKHTAEEFVGVINRMARYYPDGSMAGTEGRGRAQTLNQHMREEADKNPSWGFAPGVKKTDLAAYLATINMSGDRPLPATLKTLPRPRGKATKVIITQYDLPRKDTVPHDSDMDANGNFWYTDESRPFFGKLDTKTGEIKEWPAPAAPAGEVSGVRDVTIDKEGNPWFPIFAEANEVSTVHKFDVKTEKLTKVEGARGQFMATDAMGKIWVGFIRIDPKTATIDGDFSDYVKAPDQPKGLNFTYQNAVNSKGVPYGTAFVTGYIATEDPVTRKARFLAPPTPNAMPRRGRMDAQDRFWFTEYIADKLAMIDTTTDKIKEWSVPIRYAAPYTMSTPDKSGRVYASSNTLDSIIRLDPPSGELVIYLMPTHDFDSKKMSIDPSGKALWLANTRNARLVKVEPLD